MKSISEVLAEGQVHVSAEGRGGWAQGTPSQAPTGGTAARVGDGYPQNSVL